MDTMHLFFYVGATKREKKLPGTFAVSETNLTNKPDEKGPYRPKSNGAQLTITSD